MQCVHRSFVPVGFSEVLGGTLAHRSRSYIYNHQHRDYTQKRKLQYLWIERRFSYTSGYRKFRSMRDFVPNSLWSDHENTQPLHPGSTLMLTGSKPRDFATLLKCLTNSKVRILTSTVAIGKKAGHFSNHVKKEPPVTRWQTSLVTN